MPGKVIGRKQRLGIAIALLGDPRLLILNEPVNGLDPQGILAFRDMMPQLNRELGITILISSRIPGELSKIAAHYGIINNGRIVKERSAQESGKTCRSCLFVRIAKAPAAAKLLKSCLPMEHCELSGERHALHLFGVQDPTGVDRLLWRLAAASPPARWKESAVFKQAEPFGEPA